MSRRRHTAEQIIGKLRTAEIELAKGLVTAEVVRELGITEQTYYRWRSLPCARCFRASGLPGAGAGEIDAAASRGDL